MALVLILAISCKKSDQGQVPEVFTKGVRMVTPSSAICDGEIKSNGGSRLIEQGFCWSTGHLPVIKDNKIMMGFQDVCRYSTKVIGLGQQTVYYMRAYAINSIGTAYGEELSFTTPADHLPGETGTVTDVEGNIYKTISIGSQVWMAENLKTTRYCNGDIIGTTSPATLYIVEETTPKYQWAYNGDEKNVATYGRLYTECAVADIRNVCPAGWHIPSIDEWQNLITYLGGTDVAGGKLKEAGTAHWQSPNFGATNYFGFTALPAGIRTDQFINIGIEGIWWLSEVDWSNWSAPVWHLYSTNSNVLLDFYNNFCGLSVRCIKDN